MCNDLSFDRAFFLLRECKLDGLVGSPCCEGKLDGWCAVRCSH